MQNPKKPSLLETLQEIDPSTRVWQCIHDEVVVDCAPDLQDKIFEALEKWMAETSGHTPPEW